MPPALRFKFSFPLHAFVPQLPNQPRGALPPPSHVRTWSAVLLSKSCYLAKKLEITRESGPNLPFSPQHSSHSAEGVPTTTPEDTRLRPDTSVSDKGTDSSVIQQRYQALHVTSLITHSFCFFLHQAVFALRHYA